MAHLSISPCTVSAGLHLADAPQILDMRDDEDAAADPRCIPGARVLSLAKLEASDLASGAFICVCQKGGKISQLGAAILNDRGASAQYMAGGHLVWVTERLPLMRSRPVAARWIVSMDPTWDELTALWVLRRLVDRQAAVMPVTRDWTEKAAETWDGCIVPSGPADMAALAELTHPSLAALASGPDRLVDGRLARTPSPLGALDLVDDWLAGDVA